MPNAIALDVSAETPPRPRPPRTAARGASPARWPRPGDRPPGPPPGEVEHKSHGASFAPRGLGAEYGMSWVLPRYVGVGHALDLLLSSRVFEADEAKDLGLVNRVLEPGEVLPAAREYARDLARDLRLLGRRVCVACPPR